MVIKRYIAGGDAVINGISIRKIENDQSARETEEALISRRNLGFNQPFSSPSLSSGTCHVLLSIQRNGFVVILVRIDRARDWQANIMMIIP